jgi:dodecin
MSVARIVEISSTSDKSFEDAVVQGIARASKTLREIKSAWVKDQEVTATGCWTWNSLDCETEASCDA